MSCIIRPAMGVALSRKLVLMVPIAHWLQQSLVAQVYLRIANVRRSSCTVGVPLASALRTTAARATWCRVFR